MRKCIRCGTEMEEGIKFTGGCGNVIRKKGLTGKAVYPKAVVCPHYVDEEQLEKLVK